MKINVSITHYQAEKLLEICEIIREKKQRRITLGDTLTIVLDKYLNGLK